MSLLIAMTQIAYSTLPAAPRQWPVAPFVLLRGTSMILSLSRLDTALLSAESFTGVPVP